MMSFSDQTITKEMKLDFFFSAENNFLERNQRISGVPR